MKHITAVLNIFELNRNSDQIAVRVANEEARRAREGVDEEFYINMAQLRLIYSAEKAERR